jgi:hypothetical protein
MHIAESTGLSGRKVRIMTDKGTEVVGVIASECWAFFYFRDAEVTEAGNGSQTAVTYQVGKGEIAELEQI